tara:strand:- start:2944 stop:3387 length:444 start_codon:yes stop_codon:yes gene_type:complete
MAHFAKINDENKVLSVTTLDDKDMKNDEGVEVESIGQQYLETHNNWPAQMWIQTSYNTAANVHKEGGTPLRGNYAGIGYEWDATNQIFWPEQPYPSWVKNTSTACWESPIGNAPALTEEQISQNQAMTNTWVYVWNESSQTWNLTDS